MSRPVAFDTPRFERFTCAVRAAPFLMCRRKLLSEGLPVHSWIAWYVKED